MKRKTVVGWEEWVSLPDLGILAIKAKVDTGAKTSALHAFSIEKYQEGDKTKVRFGVHPIPDRPEIELFCSADFVEQREVISSNGDSELRYIISTPLRIGEEQWDIEISLANRETMAFRMLLGRSAMEDKVIVNPMASCMTGVLSPDVYHVKHRSIKCHRSLKIGILSRESNSYSTRRLAEAAEQRGHHAEVIHTTHCYMNISAKKPEIYLHGKPLEGYDAIIPRIGSSITFYGMAVVRQFEMMGVYCLNSSASIAKSRDKLYAHQLLSQKGISMPMTGFAHSPDDTKHLIKTIGNAPFIIKLLEGTQGKGVVLAETDKAAESVITAFRGLDAHILVQEFIKEAHGADVRCFVIGNKVVAAIERLAATGEFRSNLHQGGIAQQVKISSDERVMAVNACKILGLSVAGVDFIRSKEGPMVLEVNSSPGLKGIETVSGKDIAGYIIEFIEKQPRHERCGK
jgi:ribosomal protein S6--L-glutamate ligase